MRQMIVCIFLIFLKTGCGLGNVIIHIKILFILRTLSDFAQVLILLD